MLSSVWAIFLASGRRGFQERLRNTFKNKFQSVTEALFFSRENREADHLERSLHCACNLRANANALRCVGDLWRIWTARLPGAIKKHI
jgi:hypothetical protein